MGLRAVAVLLVASTLLEFGAADCAYERSFEHIVPDSEEAQEIVNLYVPSVVEGFQIDMTESTKNELIVRVWTNISGYSPLITATEVDLSVNINGLLGQIPSPLSSGGSQVSASLFLTGLLQAMAYRRDDLRSLVPAAGASLLFANMMGAKADGECPYVLMEITLPRLRCFEETDEGFLVNDCPLAPTGPTGRPTNEPTLFPTEEPTFFPSTSPTLFIPTKSPTPVPTLFPTVSPTVAPTFSPTTSSPTTSSPTESPTPEPTTSCEIHVQSNPCESRPDCYTAYFSDDYFDALTSSPNIDPVLAEFFVAILNTSCMALEDLTDGLNCLFLRPGSCSDAIADGYCGNTDLFSTAPFAHLAGYDRPSASCSPVIDLNYCDGITDQSTCEATEGDYLGAPRRCIWLDVDGAPGECMTLAVFDDAQCVRSTVAGCANLYPICSAATGTCKGNCVDFPNIGACEADPGCQWLEGSGGFACKNTARFEASDCADLEAASCVLAKTANTFLDITNLSLACDYNSPNCEPKELLAVIGAENNFSGCHPPHTKLELQTGPVEIKDISVGDFVKSVGGFEPVTAIIHADMGATGSYYRINTKSTFVDISNGHLMRANGVLSDPSQVKPGDVVETVWGEELVTSITMNRYKGVYHVYTRSGLYYADGVLVSDQHGLSSWNSVSNTLFSLWKSFTSLRYSLGMPIINDNKVMWFGGVMRTIDSLPLLVKLPAGAVAGSLGFVYGNIVTTEPTVLATMVVAGALLRGSLRK